MLTKIGTPELNKPNVDRQNPFATARASNFDVPLACKPGRPHYPESHMQSLCIGLRGTSTVQELRLQAGGQERIPLSDTQPRPQALRPFPANTSLLPAMPNLPHCQSTSLDSAPCPPLVPYPQLPVLPIRADGQARWERLSERRVVVDARWPHCQRTRESFENHVARNTDMVHAHKRDGSDEELSGTHLPLSDLDLDAIVFRAHWKKVRPHNLPS